MKNGGWKIFFLGLLLVCWLVPASVFAGAPAKGEFLLLLSNDDGYKAPGLRALAEALAAVGQVVVAAPAENQSGTGHGTSTGQFIAVRPIEIVPGVVGHALAARPATWVRLALEALMSRKPDLVVSGINRGMNLGLVSFYSGTVAAAREGVFLGIPAIAVSLQGDAAEDYAATAASVRRLVVELQRAGQVRRGLFLNVNAPAGEPRGVRFTRSSLTAPQEVFTRVPNPRGEIYFRWDYRDLADDEEGTDVWAVRKGFIAIPPLPIDPTRVADLDWLQKLELVC